jgi:ELWxxDGT repeat protein
MKKFLLMGTVLATAFFAGAQVTQINANRNLQFMGSAAANKALFFSQVDNTLWASDGTSAGTIQLSANITHQATGLSVNGKTIFRGSTAATGSELFVTDGTPGGTSLLKDIYPGTNGSSIGDDMAVLNGYVYFTATSPANGREVWKTDGTPAGTTLLKDITIGTAGSNTGDNFNLFSNGSYLLFAADTPTQGIELWKSDGTEAGTVLVKDINAGASSSNTKAFFKLGNNTLFYAETNANGGEVWKTDGTEAGTQLVKDIYPGPLGSASLLSPFFYEMNGRAYFNANDGINGEELWSTDGTAASTVLIKDIQTGPNGSFNILVNAVQVNNRFIFASTNLFGSRYQLWQCDGTAAGTTLLKDFGTTGGELPIILPAYEYANGGISQPLFQGNKFFLMATTPAEGTELWICDGTTAGTQLVKDIRPGSSDGLDNFTYVYTNNAFYFSANDGVKGTELWRTDGTTGNTLMAADINPLGSSTPQLWPIIGNKLFLTANDGNSNAADLYVLNANVNPLPIKLLELTVTAIANNAQLQWTTAQEINSARFMVQRSWDGSRFENIGQVQAAGQSQEKRSYTYLDAGVALLGKPVAYYRLLMIDADGKTEQTKTVTLKWSKAGWTVQLLTNPVQSSLLLKLNGLTDKAILTLADMNGRKLYSTELKANGNITLPVGELAKGMYLLTVESNGSRTVTKFVK